MSATRRSRRHRGLDLRRRRAVELVAAGRLLGLRVRELLLELPVALGHAVPDLLLDLVGLVLREHAAVDELLGEDLADRRLLLDLRRHLGLRVGGLVGLVVAEAPVADQVDQDVVAELLAEGEAEAHGGDAGGHVVGVDVDDRDVEALREVGGPPGRARLLRIGGEADLVVLDQVQRAADLVAVERLQVERLRHHALGREGGVAVEDDRDRRVVVDVGVRALARGLHRAGRALDDRRDVLEVAGVRLQAHDHRRVVGQLVGALGAVVVLDVAGAALRDRGHGLDRGGALELAPDRLVGAAEVVGEHVEAAAVGHADHDLAGAVGGRELDHLVEHRDRHVEALDRELLLAQVGLVHEALERVDHREAAQQRGRLVVGERLAEGAGLDLLAQPGALAVRGDVLDLVGDRAAVGLAQVRERVGERGARDPDAEDPRGDLGHHLGREAERLGIERGVALGLGVERVELGREVAVHAVRLDQRDRGLDGLQQRLVGRAGRLGGLAVALDGRGRGGRGRLRRVAQLGLEILEDVLVEAVLALQVGLDDLEELAGLGALDDAMVVRRRHRHHLLGADHRADRAEPGRVADRAGGDDRALPGHQPRNGGDGSDPAGVGEREVGALEVVGGQLVLARAGDQVVEGGEELGERLAPGVADDRDHQRAAAVLALDVDRDAEVDGAVVDAVGLAVDVGEVVGHHRHLLGRGARDRVGDQVGEGDLVAGVLELLAPPVERGDGEGAERGGGRDRPRLVHVAGEHRRRALDERGVLLRRGRRGLAVAAVEDVGLHDATAGAAAVHVREVDALGLGHAARDRGDADPVGEHFLRLLLGLGGLDGRLGRSGGGGLASPPLTRPTSCAR